MALNIPTEGTNLNELKINIVDTQATFEAMKIANKVNANELYFIEQESSIIADSLKIGHTFKVNLASSNASTPFTGEQDISDIGVSGTLPIAYGGTGATSAANAPWVQKSGDTMTGVLTAKTFNSTSLTASQAVSTDANKNLVSTNLTVSDPTASGTGITYIASISQSATGKISASKSTVRSASTSQTGVTQYTADNLNTWINQLTTGSSTPTDADYYISQYVGGGSSTTTYHRRPMSALWTYIKGKITAGTYWANIKISDAAAYNATPEMATLKLNGNTGATTASTSNVSLVYNSTTNALDFVFA